MSSGRRLSFPREVGPGGVTIPGFAMLQAPPQSSEKLVGEVAQRRIVVVSGGPAFVVVCAGADRFGERYERPPMTGVTESLVADLAGFDVVRAPRSPGDRRGTRKGPESGSGGEPCWIIADFGEDSGCKDRPEARNRPEDRRPWVRVECACQLVFERVHGLVHRRDDAQQPGGRRTQRRFDLRWLTQSWGLPRSSPPMMWAAVRR